MVLKMERKWHEWMEEVGKNYLTLCNRAQRYFNEPQQFILHTMGKKPI